MSPAPTPPPSPRRPARPRPAIALAAGSAGVALTLLCLELACQIYARIFVFPDFDKRMANPRHYYVASDDDVLAYQLAPGKRIEDRLAINSHGIRDASEEPREGRRRIALLGDSVVFGIAHDQDRTLSALLEAELDPQRRDGVRVLNFGLPGTNLLELRRFLELKDAIYDVHDVLLLLNPNDFATRNSIYEGADNGMYRSYRRPALHSLWFVRKVVYRWNKRGQSSVRWYEWMFEGRGEWGFDQLRRMRDESRARGSTLSIVFLPAGVAYADDGSFALAGIYDRLDAFCRTERIACLDPTSAMAHPQDELFDHTDHLTDAGNLRLAREMAAFVRATGPATGAPEGRAAP